MKVSLQDWLDDPERVVQSAFALDGPIAAALPGYMPRREQIGYATALAVAAARGGDPEMAGFVTPVEGSTGLGKSLAVLFVVCLTAVLRGKRGLITTYTRSLNRDLTGEDARVARQAVWAMTGKRPEIAMRRPHSAFASPTACRRQAELLRRADEAEGLLESDVESAQALEALADWTDGALARARAAKEAGEERAFAQAFDGLIETFLAENTQHEMPLNRVPYDLYTLHGSEDEEEEVAFRIFYDLARKADVLIATHAALVRDQLHWGKVLDPDGGRYSIVVADEANRLEDAGRTSLGRKRAISSMALDREAIARGIRGTSMETRQEVMAITIDEHNEIAERLLQTLSAQAQEASERRIRVTGREPWLDDLRAVQATTVRILRALASETDLAVEGLRSRLQARAKDVDHFLDSVRRMCRSAEYARSASIPPEDRSYDVPMVDFTPLRMEPSLMTVPKRGARVVSRLWNRRGGTGADAFILTSATLATPGLTGPSAFASILNTVGLSPDANNINSDLARSFEATDFGRLVELVLADPTVDTPSGSRKGEQDERSYRSPSWLAYACRGIAAAHADCWRQDGRNRVLVLATSFDEAQALGEGVRGLLPDAEIRVRRRDERLEDGFDWLSERHHAILITPGAFEGVNRPGLIDNEVIPRLPYPPPLPGLRDGVFTYVGEQGVELPSRALDTMLQQTRQGFGRMFRKHDDACKLWILDPRIGLPAAVQRRMRLVPHERSRPNHLAAIPARFEFQVAAARVFFADEGREEAA